MIKPYKGITPDIHKGAFIEESAQIIGDVVIGEESSIWFNAVVRGDVNYIRIGKRTNVQDGSLLHVDHKKYFLVLEDDITIGHGVILHGCHIKSRCLIGMGAIIMDGAEVGEDVIIGAGATVTPKTSIPPRSLAVGTPAKTKRGLTDAEINQIKNSASNYVKYFQEYQY